MSKNNKPVRSKTKLNESQIVNICRIMAENHYTIRKTIEEWNKKNAKKHRITKSTLFEYIHNQLPELDKKLYKKILKIMKENSIMANKVKKGI